MEPEVLFRDLYRGEIVWNRTRKRNRWGEKRVADRPADDWIRIPAPALRIVSDETWEAAHARIAEARAVYRDATKGLRGGRPRVESKYLLPGFARCGCCNGGLFVSSANHGSSGRRRRVFVYGCTSHHNKGRSVCLNGLRVPMEALDHAVLDAIRKDILAPDIVEDIIARVRELLEPPADKHAQQRDRVARELADVGGTARQSDGRDRHGREPRRARCPASKRPSNGARSSSGRSPRSGRGPWYLASTGRPSSGARVGR